MVTFNRSSFSGQKDALVIAIDIGTTFSGVSYTILRPDQRPEVYSVVGFKGQEDQPSNTKVPTIVYYDQAGKLCACGSEAASRLQEDEEYIKTEWFKLLLRPKDLMDPPAGMPNIYLPANRTVVDVLGDFLSYMNRCAQEYITHVHSDGQHIWSSLGTEATYILTHPNGWQGFQQGQIREAAVRGGLVPDTPEGRGRIQFLTEGEASFHWCVDIGLTGPETLSEGSHIIVADAGGGTIDVSSYEVLSTHPLQLKENREAQCKLAGSIFVTASFKNTLKELLKSSVEFDDDEYTERAIEEFDRKTKCLFDDPEKFSFIKLGNKKQHEPSLNIRGGLLKLSGNTIAATFKHSCNGTVDAISTQLKGSTEATVFLVGGFAASPWLYSEVKRRLSGVFRNAHVNLKRADSHTAKAVAHGAVAWYLDRLVTARVARQTYGTDCATLFDKSNADHCSRSHLARISDASGLLFIGPLFRALVTKGEAIQTDSVFRRSFTVERRQKSDVLYVMTLDRYDGTIEDIDFYDKDKESFSTVCRMPIPIPAEAFEPCIGLKGMFWHVSVDVVLSLGETEVECHAEWEVEGEKKRSRVFTEWIGDANSRTRSRPFTPTDVSIPTTSYPRMQPEERRRSVSFNSTSATSISPGLSSFPLTGSVSQRRASWSKARDSYEGQLPMPDPPEPPPVVSYVPRQPRQLHHSYSSQASLDSNASVAHTDGDDEIHLTSAASGPGDPERSEQRTRRRVSRPPGHYGETSAPRRTLGTLKSVSRNLRRVSVRVVNLAGVTLEDRPIRLEDDTPDETRPGESTQEDAVPEVRREQLRGRTLGLFGPQSRFRLAMLRVLLWKWTEPLILLLIFVDAIVLIIQAHRSVFITGREDGFFGRWEDYVLFVLFLIFSLEALARILVTGLLLDPETRITDTQTLIKGLMNAHSRVHSQFSGSTLTLDTEAIRQNMADGVPEKHSYPPSTPGSTTPVERKVNNTWVGSKVGLPTRTLPFQIAIEKQQSLSARNLPYLRHSWNRIDFIAVISFWVTFALAVSGAETQVNRHLYIFRALSVLRISRLLAVTSGTTTIMKSLKTAGPILVQVATFVLFAVLLFSIVGVQSFKGSFRRTCRLIDPSVEDRSAWLDLKQTCGGQIGPDSENTTAYFYLDGRQAPESKGYICPLGQLCQESPSNPHSDLQGFDNIFIGALQVLIIAGANQWSTSMYMMMDADFYVSCIFFIVCIVILNFWLINLFVAVITNTFSSIRAETKRSAFGASAAGPVIDEKGEEWSMISGKQHDTRSRLQDWYMRTRIGWVLLIAADLIVQGTRTSTSSQSHLQFLDVFELTATIAFDIEMVWRICSYFPDWRAFGSKKSNYLDLALCIITSIIQIPPIHDAGFYPWLTIFQLLRFYRVILAVPTMRPLLLRVFGNMGGLFNMTLFLLFTNLLGALIAVQLFRGDIRADDHMNFGQTYTAFLAMYQIFSSENWTDVLYLAADDSKKFKQTLIAVLFFAAWFLFANFILLQMFIAVINENFEVAEEQKRSKQFEAFLHKTEPRLTRVNWLNEWNPYRFVKSNPKSVVVESMPSGLILPLKKTVVQDSRTRINNSSGSFLTKGSEPQKGFTGTLRRLFDLDQEPESVQMTALRTLKRDSVNPTGSPDDDTNHHLDYITASVPDPSTEEAHEGIIEERARKADFIEAHPTYDKPFWILSNQNPLRKFCQLLVPPAGGDRIFGVPPSPVAAPIFKLFIILAVVGGIVVAWIATPMYRRTYYLKNGLDKNAWFDIADVAFGGVLILEFLIKVIADGFIFTPNAYLLSIWNVIDFLILNALLVNMISTLIVAGGVSRLTRALKAFRTLRLITFFPWMRDTFHSVLFAGAQSLFEAALLALLYMIPYAIWGLNLFSGVMYTCNDGGVAGKASCVNEYFSVPIDDSDIGFLAPRSWDKPSPSTTFSFDSFGSSLLILFEVVSFEGWIDVMGVAMDVVGKDMQPQLNNAQLNSIFFLIYDLLGAVIILTLFVSIIIGNFSSRSGMALLTEEQKRWIDLQKLIKRQRPSKRPKIKPSTPWRAWCYDRAVSKNGWWSRTMTGLYLFHILALMTQAFSNSPTINEIRDILFLVLTFIYFIDITVRVCGLGLRSFRANGWNLFDVVVVSGSFATTVPIVFGSQGFTVEQLQKLFLVCIAFKLVQKQNSLNRLFKLSISSLPAILKLLLLWIFLFLFFAIVSVEVFGLTRWESAETHNQNYRSVANALLMLVFMSVGEGWNQYMHDFTVSYPQCTNSTPETPDSDCGSVAWAYCVFIAWNLLSMYIFVNMFTGVVVENFSYVFQLDNSHNSIDRHQMRAFKKVWSSFDVDGTGYLNRASIVPFLAKLTGVFEVRIYPAEFAIKAIINECQVSAKEPRTPYSAPVVHGIDMGKLGETLNKIDHQAISQRRRVYVRLYHEAVISAESGKGISFTNMLLLLAHHKIIDDQNALRLDELLHRRATTDYVTDLVNLDRVRSLLRMIACRRRYLAYREAQAAAEAAENQDIPAIVVENSSASLHRSWDITTADKDFAAFRVGDEPPSPSPTIRPLSTADTSASVSLPGSPILAARPRHSDVSVLSGDFSLHPDVRRESIALSDATPQQVLSTLDASVWGEMMHEAAEDD